MEATDRIGGRVLKNNKFTDYAIELGGEELYLKDSNYYKLCEKMNAKIMKRDEDMTWIEDPINK